MTVFAVKDRVLAHNPLGAIYSEFYYSKNGCAIPSCRTPRPVFTCPPLMWPFFSEKHNPPFFCIFS